MSKAFMIASLTAFVAVAAFASPGRDGTIPSTAATSEEIVGNPSDEQGMVPNFKPVEEKSQGCGCNIKPKKGKR